MENRKYSDLDVQQIIRQKYDPELEADRVVIVGTDTKIDVKLGDLKLPEPKVIEVPVIVKEVQIVEVPVITKEVQVVEVPIITIVRETHVEQISVPSYIEIPKIVEIEKPIIIKERETEVRTIEVPVIVREEKEVIPKYIYFILGLSVLINIVTTFMRG